MQQNNIFRISEKCNLTLTRNQAMCGVCPSFLYWHILVHYPDSTLDTLNWNWGSNSNELLRKGYHSDSDNPILTPEMTTVLTTLPAQTYLLNWLWPMYVLMSRYTILAHPFSPKFQTPKAFPHLDGP